MAGRVEGKVALVTGGASGIGRATALTFAREGAKLVIADMNEEGGQQTVHMITENGGEATFIQVDVTSASTVEAMISKTVEIYGRLVRCVLAMSWLYPDPLDRSRAAEQTRDGRTDHHPSSCG